MATVEDWPRLRAIQATSLSSGWPDLLRTALVTGNAASRSPLDRTPTPARGPFAVVALATGTRVGYALVLPDGDLADETAPDRDASDTHHPGESRPDGTATLTLVELAVASGHRGRGHGSALLETVLAVDDDRAVELTVRADDRRARRFYAEHGFRVHERLPEYYGDEAGLLLVGEE